MTGFELAPLDHGSLTERAVEALLDEILAQRLEPGTSLPSAGALAERLRVSRPVVREALNALKALGIVEIANGKKATIRDLDNTVLRVYFRRALQVIDGSIRDVMEVRIGVETRAAALAALNRGDRDVTQLKDLQERMESSLGDAARFSRHDSAFHIAIAEASGNRLIFHVVELLETALRAASYQGVRLISSGPAVNAIVDEHRRLIDAIERRDEVHAGALMHDHLAAAMHRMGLA